MIHGPIPGVNHSSHLLVLLSQLGDNNLWQCEQFISSKNRFAWHGHCILPHTLSDWLRLTQGILIEKQFVGQNPHPTMSCHQNLPSERSIFLPFVMSEWCQWYRKELLLSECPVWSDIPVIILWTPPGFPLRGALYMNTIYIKGSILAIHEIHFVHCMVAIIMLIIINHRPITIGKSN